MRVLFTAAPAIGHAFPMVPLAWAFRAAGHDVTFVTAGDAVAVASAGLHVVDALPGRTTRGMLAQFVEDVPELFAPFDGDPLEAMNERKPYIVACWDPYVDEYVAAAEEARPDLVVYDPIFGAGALVGAKLDVPAVAHGNSLARYTPELMRELPGAVAFSRHGVKLPDGIQTIDIAPPSLAEGPPSDLVMRHVPYNGGAVLPDLLSEPPSRPRIAVTFGSMDGRFGAFIERIVAVASEVDAEFVVTLGETDASTLGDLPPNVRTTDWLPLSALLPTCVATVHHGGGTSLTCCALGVPQMVLSGGPDMLVEAELLRARGVAHVRRADDLDRAAIDALLTDDELRRNVAEVRTEIAALPAPAELVPQLCGLADR